MHISRPLSGIRRIFPLIKQHAADCITVLPGFGALPRGTRLAIDATLWIQRLHFAGGDQHPDRHVFGFHRLIKQLRQNDLIPIMVFDNFGQQARLPAKTREHQRRRSHRCMLTLRAKIEQQRSRRLQVLQSILEQYRQLQSDEQAYISRLLSGWRDGDVAQHEQERLMSLSHDDESAWDEAMTSEEARETVLEMSAEFRDLMEEQDYELDNLVDSSSTRHEEEHCRDTLSEAWSDVQEQNSIMSRSYMTTGRTFGHSRGAWDDAMWTQVAEAEESDTVRLAARIRALRRQYALHVARANAGAAVSFGVSSDWPKETQIQQQMTASEGEVYRLLEAGAADPQISTTLSATEEEKEADEDVQNLDDVVATKLAQESELDEIESEAVREEDRHGQDLQDSTHATSRFEEIAEHDDGGVEQATASTERTEKVFDSAALDDLETLTERNAHMQRYYVRSSTSLSQSAFESCASLCEMLNVPVLWTGAGVKGQGRPHEAEAMAAMLVRHGYADMVVSEDSDVLLYDVPLLRGVMGAKKLELVDSSAVRRKLFPHGSAPVSLVQLRQKRDATTIATHDEKMTEEEDKEGFEVIDAEQSVLSAVESEHEGGEAEELQSDDVEERISRRQMLDFALLCGTDFNRTIPGIAASRALRLIQEFGSIDGIRAEAIRRAALDKRRARRIANRTMSSNGASNTVVRTSSKILGPQSDPTGSSLIPSLRNESGLRTPDHLTWREYGKELTQARHVFEHPPTLFWQLRKVRALKRDKAESIDSATLAASKVDRKAVRAFMRNRGAKDEEWEEQEEEVVEKEVGSRKRVSLAGHVVGFGQSPYGDGGPVASWP